MEEEGSMLVDTLNQPKMKTLNPHLLPPSCNIDICFENIFLQVPQVSRSRFSKNKKQILKGVSGIFKSGELTAIMGPSGAGKSSLLNVLSGFIKEGVEGNIFTNDLLEDKKNQELKRVSVYILQDDYLLPFFSVQEIMLHAANVKLGRGVSTSDKLLLIEILLESMSLKHSKKTRCNKLSGGERKRLSVCLELLDNPSVLFLDEPTSGLDSSSCGLLVSELKGLAHGGRTVICTIHQPSAAVLSMFDHLYILSDGKVVYQGDTSQLINFLDYINLPCPIFHNPADFMMDVVTGEFGSYTDKFASALRNKNWRTEISALPTKNSGSESTVTGDNYYVGIIKKSKKKHTEWDKFSYLVPQLAKQLHRDWIVTYFKVLMNVLIGTLVGVLFLGTGNTAAKVFPNLGYIFASLTYFSFTSLMPAALRFPGEMEVLRKEHFNNWYKFTTFYMAFIVVNIPLQILLTFLYVGPSYVITGQALELKRFLVFFGVNINSSVLSVILGIYMGTLGPIYGVFGGSIFIIVMCLLGGFLSFINNFPLPLYILSFFNFLRHSFEIILTGLYGMNREKLPCPNHLIYCHFKNPQMVFKETGLDPANLTRDVIILVLITISAGFVTYLKLRSALKNVK